MGEMCDAKAGAQAGPNAEATAEAKAGAGATAAYQSFGFRTKNSGTSRLCEYYGLARNEQTLRQRLG